MNKKEFDAVPENERFNCVLEGEVYYASVHTPNMSAVKKYNADPFFGVNIGLKGDQLARAKELGLNVREANDSIPLPYVAIKRKVKEGKTEDQCRPSVVDEMQNPIPQNVLIGNGSKILCKFATYWYEAGGGGVGSTLLKVQVKELIAYNPDSVVDAALDMNEDGFNISDYLASEGIKTPVEAPVVNDDLVGEPSAGAATNPDIFDE